MTNFPKKRKHQAQKKLFKFSKIFLKVETEEYYFLTHSLRPENYSNLLNTAAKFNKTLENSNPRI